MPGPLGNSDQNDLNNPTSCSNTTHPNCILMNPKTHNETKARNGSLPNLQSSCSKAAEITSNGTSSSGSSSKAATASRLLFNSFCSRKPNNSESNESNDDSRVSSKNLVTKTASDASNETNSSCINEESSVSVMSESTNDHSVRNGSSSLNRRKTSNTSIKKNPTSS